MDSTLSLAVGATAISVGAWYWFSSNPKPQSYPLNVHLETQSFVTESGTGVHRSHPDLVQNNEFTDMKSIYDVFAHGCKRSEHEPCFGQRSSTAEPYSWITYAEVRKQVAAFSGALPSLLSSPQKMIGIQSGNCLEWFIVQLACALHGYAIVPLYDTFGPTALDHILREAELEVVLCATVDRARDLVRMASPFLRRILIIQCTDDQLNELRIPVAGNAIQFDRFDSLMKFSPEIRIPKKTDNLDRLYMVCYTSGSCGIPKGVLIKQRNFLFTIKSQCQRIEDVAILDNPVHICYLPLAHILEQLASFATLLFGGRIGFLTGDFSGLLEDMKALRPTYMFTVPRVLSRIYATLTHRLSSYPTFFMRGLQYAIDRKNRQLERGYYEQYSLLDAVFFRPVRNALGGRMLAIVCGGAPLPPHVMRFARAAFNCPVLQAYGLTETCGVVSMNYYGESRSNHAGPLIPGIQVKLVDVPEMGISVSRNGNGEVCVKGPNCTEGYFKDAERTRELIDKQGWLHTGDLGRWEERGSLQIVGRCKASFKLSQGEYVSPEKVESVYQLSGLVDQVFVDGRSTYDFPVAIVVPNLRKLRQHADGSNSHSSSQVIPEVDDDICSSRSIQQLILDEFDRLGRTHGLKGFELVKAIHVTPSPFTIANQLLTANLKLSRVNLRQFYASVIDRLYGTDTTE